MSLSLSLSLPLSVSFSPCSSPYLWIIHPAGLFPALPQARVRWVSTDWLISCLSQQRRVPEVGPGAMVDGDGKGRHQDIA